MDAVGVHQFWGFSPACDVVQMYRTAFGCGGSSGEGGAPLTATRAGIPGARGTRAWGLDGAGGGTPSSAVPAEADPIRVLCVSPGDIRHVLKTVAQRHLHGCPAPPLHFYVYERTAEVLARHLVLLAAAVDASVPIRQRAATWLEVYGNAMIQSRTARHVSTVLLPPCERLVVGEEGRVPQPLRSLVDVSWLKHKQRDEVESALRACRDGVAADMPAWRDQRCRHHYGTRYDFRNNLIDWDYQTVIRPCAGCIHFTQYRDWRNTGVAFEYGDQVYDAPNRTMASYAEGRERGSSVAVRGYWGDVVVSPYHALGTAAWVPTDVEATTTGGAAAPSASTAGNYASQLYQITSRRLGSEQWRHHAVEIATYNLLSWLWEMENGRPYVMRAPHDIYSGLAEPASPPSPAGGDGTTSPAGGAGTTDAVPPPAPATTVAAAAAAAADAAEAQRAASLTRAFEGVRITLLSGEFDDWLSRGKLAGLFHVVTLSGRAVHFMDKAGFMDMLAPSGCVVVAETGRNVVTLRPDQAVEFSARVLGMAAAQGLAVLGSDRQVSADTFAVGTVLSLKATASTSPSAVGGGAIKPEERVFTPHPPFVPTVSAGGAGVGAGGGSAGLATGAAGGDATNRTRGLPMAAYTLNPAPHPHLPLVPDDAPATVVQRTAAVAASRLVAAARQVRDHDPQGGDNPLPEALVFAAVPASGLPPLIASTVKAMMGVGKAGADAGGGTTGDGCATPTSETKGTG